MTQTPSTLNGRERGMSVRTPEELAGAPGSVRKKGGPSPRDEEIEQLRKVLKDLRIEVEGRVEIIDELVQALYQAIDSAVWGILRKSHFVLEECDELPDSITYASGMGFRWIKTAYCFGVVENYHIIIEVVEGYTGGYGGARLKSIELVKGDVNER